MTLGESDSHRRNMTSAANAKSEIACGACGAANDQANQFCSGCGESLWEKCGDCGANVLLQQKFCNQCGVDLQSRIADRLKSRQEQLTRARNLMAEGQFKSALRIAESLAKPPDYRFQESATEAQQLNEECSRQFDQWQSRVEELPEQVERRLAEQDFKTVVSLLEPVPKSLLSDDLAVTLGDCQRKVEVSKQAKRNLKKALADKQWVDAAGELAQILDVFPGNKKYSAILGKVRSKITRSAQKLKAAGSYADALQTLDVLPPQFQDDDQQAEREQLEELIFLRKLTASAPFCYPLIGSILEQLKRLTSEDERVEQLRRRFSKLHRNRPQKSHHLFSSWMKPRSGVLGKGLVPSTLPTSLPGAWPSSLEKAGARFWGAYGLALQGLGHGAEDGSFERTSKGGMLGLLGRRKATSYDSAWGIDVGNASVKAIRLSQKEGQVQIEDALLAKIDHAGHGNSRRPSPSVLFRSLEKVMSQAVFGDTPVVANLPSCDVLSRYLELPVQSPKQHATFIEQEARANIPINFDLLATTNYKFDVESEADVSQRAVLLALRKADVESRLSMWDKLKVNLVGLVAEPFAYVNALKAVNYLDELEANSPASSALILDVGHASSLVMLARKSGCWFRHLDWGIHDLTTAIAKELKLGYADADSVRRNIVSGGAVVERFRILENATAVAKRELQRSLRAAKEHLQNFDISTALLTGGGAYQPLLGSLLNGEEL